MHETSWRLQLRLATAFMFTNIFLRLSIEDLVLLTQGYGGWRPSIFSAILSTRSLQLPLDIKHKPAHMSMHLAYIRSENFALAGGHDIKTYKSKSNITFILVTKLLNS